jgi:predicted nucleotidyltransferase
MQEENIYIQQLKDKLKELNLYLVLLFGSYAYGTPHKDSDIDLLVVTNDEYIPKNFDEKNEIYLRVSRQIRPINQEIPIDLLVYTIPMYKKFLELNSSFAREVTQKGKILYERYNQRVA